MYIAISDFQNFGYKDKYNKLQSQLLNKFVFGNIDKTCHYTVMNLVSAMHNLGKSRNNNAKVIKPLMIYGSDGCLICLRNWQNKHYFIEVFPILFSFGDDNYLAKCKIIILLKIQAN